jgi:hypothetical protein
MKQLRILEANEVGHGILIETDAGWVSPKDIRNADMLKESANLDYRNPFEFYAVLQKYNTPNIFINCSYPCNKDWKNSSFSEIKLKSIMENVNIHMNSYIWIARLVAENMKKNKGKKNIQNKNSEEEKLNMTGKSVAGAPA